MADWRTHNPSNKPGTCLWCGWKLRTSTRVDGSRHDKAGSYQDDAFCGLRCAYLFAVQMVKFGHRIAPKD